MTRTLRFFSILALSIPALAGCTGSSEAPTVELPVIVSSAGLAPAITKLSIGGETHESAGVTPLGLPPELGHTVHIEGVAARDGQEHSFRALLDIDEDMHLIGAPFEVSIAANSQDTLVLEALVVDPFEGDTLFDGIDFAALPVTPVPPIIPSPPRH